MSWPLTLFTQSFQLSKLEAAAFPSPSCWDSNGSLQIIVDFSELMGKSFLFLTVLTKQTLASITQSQSYSRCTAPLQSRFCSLLCEWFPECAAYTEKSRLSELNTPTFGPPVDRSFSCRRSTVFMFLSTFCSLLFQYLEHIQTI